MSENGKWDRNTSEKVKTKQDSKETIDISDSRFYNKITISS